MKVRPALLVALAAAVTLTSAAAAGPGVARQRVALSAKGVLNQGASSPSGFGAFALTPLQAGALDPDSGTMTSLWRRVVVREGQRLVSYDAVSDSKGKRGSLVVRERVRWLDAGDGSHPGTGTWTVVRGTGQYARIAGGGRNVTLWLERGPWSSRYEGFLTRP